jgi:hypothetical protein
MGEVTDKLDWQILAPFASPSVRLRWRMARPPDNKKCEIQQRQCDFEAFPKSKGDRLTVYLLIRLCWAKILQQAHSILRKMIAVASMARV